MNQSQFPKPEVKGVGGITYNCAHCRAPIKGEPAFYPPLPLKPETKTYHLEHMPNGR